MEKKAFPALHLGYFMINGGEIFFLVCLVRREYKEREEKRIRAVLFESLRVEEFSS